MPREVTADPTATAYATEDEADAVAELREPAVRTAWDALEDKEAVLAAASRDLDTSDWIGEQATDDQELEWPRTGTDYSDDAWPKRLVDATIELAFAYAPAYATGSTTNVLNPSVEDGNLKRKEVGPIVKEWFAARTTEATALERFPAAVQRLLTGLVRVTATSQWGSGTARRAS